MTGDSESSLGKWAFISSELKSWKCLYIEQSACMHSTPFWSFLHTDPEHPCCACVGLFVFLTSLCRSSLSLVSVWCAPSSTESCLWMSKRSCSSPSLSLSKRRIHFNANTLIHLLWDVFFFLSIMLMLCSFISLTLKMFLHFYSVIVFNFEIIMLDLWLGVWEINNHFLVFDPQFAMLLSFRVQFLQRRVDDIY